MENIFLKYCENGVCVCLSFVQILKKILRSDILMLLL